MDLYSSMPQVKTAASTSSVYTASPHVLDQSELSNQSLARSDVTKYNSDILTSSAWSAVIHHPAEDSEPDELPSTVDIDAIKEPATPLPGGACTPGGQPPTDDDEDDDDDDSESESDDPDSDSESGNESNTESEGSRGSWSESDSDSAESDASSVRGRLATPKTSSSSEAEEEQDGGRRKHADKDLGSEHYYRSRQTDPSNPMKVKISALKFTSKHKSTSKSQIAAAPATDSSSEDNGRGGGGEEEDSSADERRWKEDDDEEEESEEEKKTDDTKRTSISGNPSHTKQTSKSAIERNKYSSLQSDRESLRSAAAAFHRRPAPSNRNSYHGSSNSDSSRTGSSTTHRDSPGKIEDSRIITNSDHSSSSDFSRTGSYRDSPCKIDDSRSSKSSYHVGNSDLNRTGVSRTSSHRDSPTKIEDTRNSKSSYHGSNSDLNRTVTSRTSSHRDSPTKIEDTRNSKSSYHVSDLNRTGASRTNSFRDSPSKHEDTRNPKSSHHNDSSRTVVSKSSHRDSPSKHENTRISNSDLNKIGASRTSTHRDSPSKTGDTRLSNSGKGDSGKTGTSRTGSYRDSPSKIEDVRFSKSSYHGNSSDLNKTGASRTSFYRDSQNEDTRVSKSSYHGSSSDLNKTGASRTSLHRDSQNEDTRISKSSYHGSSSDLNKTGASRTSSYRDSQNEDTRISKSSYHGSSSDLNKTAASRTSYHRDSPNKLQDSSRSLHDSDSVRTGTSSRESKRFDSNRDSGRRGGGVLRTNRDSEGRLDDVRALGSRDCGRKTSDEVEISPSKMSRKEKRVKNASRGNSSMKSVAQKNGDHGRPVTSSSIRLRSSRKKPPEVAVSASPVPTAKQRNAAFDAKKGSEGSSSDEDGDDEEEEEEEEEKEGREYEKDEITQLAQQLVRPSSTLPISEHLQEINQEDLAAILPDVGGIGPFDEFGGAATRKSGGGGGERGGEGVRRGGESGGGGGRAIEESDSSSSDMEMLPDVSDVINRIDSMHDDSEGGGGGHLVNDDNDDDDVESETEERFNQQTEQISAGNRSLPVANAGCRNRPALDATGSRSRRRGRPPKQAMSSTGVTSSSGVLAFQPPVALPAAELEAYCQASNVSPDSGIQSVAGSPAHGRSQSPAQTGLPRVAAATRLQADGNVAAAANSPRRKPASDSDGSRQPFARTAEPITKDAKLTKLYTTSDELRVGEGGKRGPGRPLKGGHSHSSSRKKSSQKEEHQGDLSSDGMLKVPPFYKDKSSRAIKNNHEDLPRLHGMMNKRGPGRPKKSPPTLEPNLPNVEKTRKDRHHHHHHKHRHHHQVLHSNSSNSLLNDICEQVSKRLDIAEKPSSCAINGELKHKSKSSRHRHGHHHKHHKHVHKSGAVLDVAAKMTTNNGSRKDVVLPRHVALPKAIAVRHHQHKKRKKARKSVDTLNADPSFLMDLDQLVEVFQKLCHIKPQAATKLLPVGDGDEKIIKVPEKTLTVVAPPKSSKKKRKAHVEKVGKSCEKDQCHEVADGKDAAAQVGQQSSSVVPAAVKRRLKKAAAVETPKNRGDKPEAANNEQRLPLKKRHYHMSNTPYAATHSGSVSSESSPDSSLSDAKIITKSDASGKVSTSTKSKSDASVEKSAAKVLDTKAASKTVEKSCSKSGAGAGGGKGSANSVANSGGKGSTNSVAKLTKDAKSVSTESASPAALILTEEHRDSIDEAIEACINKYADGAAAAAAGAVMATPKKRHRLDVDEKKEKGAAAAVQRKENK